ncbi:deazaflavin-dependent nitroreductase [Kribbella sp. ALI-6-A]|uniref:nitroreductase/quinone reductase family protein n=1 Tax=Kribbella sp. ALI-6-A TaxID=1933817 RepID=UPI00097C09C1|nr:nitroreductase/quinone reductase family protein [Kribbella sp. ALI-6-A]ONI68022.1 deazaflavin-dependent nitroreductase [Kribbella sp. ALI-6-A]
MASTTALPGWLPFANRVVKFLHRLGLPLGTIQLLSVPGRSTGELRTTPVSPFTAGAHQYVVSPVPKSDWVRNAGAAGWGMLRRGRVSRRVTLETVTDPAEKEAALRAFPDQVPNGVPFFVKVGAVTSASPDEFAAAAPGCAVFRVGPA